MMDIKFRGKTIDTKEWIYGNLIQNDDFTFIVGKVEYSSVGYCCDCDRPYSDQWIVDPKTVGQYTGLKDKNGVEIYFSDIVKLHNKWETKTPYISKVEGNVSIGAMVRQHPAHEWLGLGCSRNLISYCVSDGCICEVVGNVYDNPELLGDDVNV